MHSNEYFASASIGTPPRAECNPGTIRAWSPGAPGARATPSTISTLLSPIPSLRAQRLRESNSATIHSDISNLKSPFAFLPARLVNLVNLVNPVRSFPGSRPTRGRNAISARRESARFAGCRLNLQPFNPSHPSYFSLLSSVFCLLFPVF